MRNMSDWSIRIEYTHEQVDNYLIPDTSGVYCLIHYYEPKNDYFRFYFGQSADMNQALHEHLNLLDRELPPPENPCCAPEHCIKKTLLANKCYFRFRVVSSKTKRNRIKEEAESAFIPKGDMEFALWADNFIRVLSANAAQWFIPPAAVAKLQDSHKEYMASYDAHLRAKSALRKQKGGGLR